MDRREFVKMLGVGGVLVGVGAITGLGCTEAPVEEPPPVDPETQTDPDAPPVEDAESPEGETDAEGDTEMVTICPQCGAENVVEEWGAELTCWNCGHTWTPQKPD